MTIETNISSIADEIIAQLTALDKDKLSRLTAENMLGIVRYRIHKEGKDAEGAKIGEYSPGYMKVRTGKFSTNDVFTKGKNKGETKPSGVFTKGKNKGQQRPKYNRTDDTTVIMSLTGQTENDFSIQPTDDGLWGLGYNNELNYAKSKFTENTYKKDIVALTDQEEETAVEFLLQKVDEILNGQGE